MEPDEIRNYIEAHQRKIQSYDLKSEYYQGFNSNIFMISKGTESWKKNRIDNRLPVPYAANIVTTYTGYMAKPGNIKYITEDDNFNETLSQIFEKNNEDLKTSTNFEKCLGLGEVFELHYHDGDFPRFANISPRKMIPVYDNKIEPELKNVIYYYKTSANILEEQLTKSIDYYNVWIYDDANITVYKSEKGWAEGTPVITPHKYNQVPVIHYHVLDEVETTQENNDFFYLTGLPYYPAIYEDVKRLIDANDRILSEDVADELQRFAQAYLKIRGYLYDDKQEDADGRTDLDKAKYDRIIQLLDDTGDAEFLTKNMDASFLQFSIEKIEKLIIKMSNMVDFSDPKAIQESGYAFRLQMLAMEFAAIKYESNYTQGLQKRIELLKDIGSIDTQYKLDEDVQVEIKWIRNIPVEVERIINNLISLANAGLISEQTAIENVPGEIIQDPEREKQRLEEEEQEREENQANFDLQARRITNNVIGEEEPEEEDENE